MYLINWSKLATLLLPTFLRKPVILAFLRAFGKPVETMHAEFLVEKTKWEYRMEHDGRVFSLKDVLNDAFDNVSRRIYITDVELQDDIYIGNRDNREQVYISAPPDDENTVYIGSAPQYYTQANFIVHVPVEILEDNAILIRNLIDEYKLAGKTYIIIEKI